MFKTEKELVVQITRNLEDPTCIESLFDKKLESKVFEELNLGYGIPDIVVVQYKDKDRIGNRKNFLNYFDISVLDLIEREDNVSVDDIVLLTRSTKNKIVETLSLLQNEKFIICREGKYFSHERYAEALEDSIAIEAKLKNWKRALQQAYRYKWFSNKAYVILPNSALNPALDNLHLFQRYGVGLASINDSDGLEVHYKAKETPPYSERMAKLLNEHLLIDLGSE